MRIIDILNAPKCKTIFYEIQEFVKQSLFEYNNAIERDSKREGFVFRIRIFLILFGELLILVGQKYAY